MWQRLAELNDRLFEKIRDTSPTRLPQYEMVYMQRKKNKVKDDLNEELRVFEKKMQAIATKFNKRVAEFQKKSVTKPEPGLSTTLRSHAKQRKAKQDEALEKQKTLKRRGTTFFRMATRRESERPHEGGPFGSPNRRTSTRFQDFSGSIFPAQRQAGASVSKMTVLLHEALSPMIMNKKTTASATSSPLGHRIQNAMSQYSRNTLLRTQKVLSASLNMENQIKDFKFAPPKRMDSLSKVPKSP